MESTGLILHGALAVGSGWAGYTYGIKRGNRDLALLYAGAQPSIAIAMSLFDLGWTFADMQGALETGGIFKAMSVKMFHMVAGIGLGVLQEIWTQSMMPAGVEEKKNVEAMRSAVIDGVSSQMSALSRQVEQVERVIARVPSDVDKLNQRMITSHRDQNDLLLRGYESNINKHAQAVGQIIKQTHSDFEESVGNLHEVTTSATATMKKDLGEATVAFGDKLRQEAQQISTAAAAQGGQVILSVAQQVATTLQATTVTSLQAAANLAKTSYEAQQIAQSLATNIVVSSQQSS